MGFVLSNGTKQKYGDYKVIIGLGLTGLSCARFFAAKGWEFVVVDSRECPPKLAEFQQFCPNVPVYLDGWHLDVLLGAKELLVSPGVSLEENAISKAIMSGISVVSDIDIFSAHSQAPVVAITGSNGKSTVTTLLGLMVEASGYRVGVGGNIGVPVLDLLDDECELYVLELSSFQLERCRELNTLVSTVLNLSPDHLDRHSTYLAYQRAKTSIYDGSEKQIFNRDDDLTRPRTIAAQKCHSFGTDDPGITGFGVRTIQNDPWLVEGNNQLIPLTDLAMQGSHNIANALAALALGRELGLPIHQMIEILKEFSGLPHRCQRLLVTGNIIYINDSKATNPGAVVAALNGFNENRNIVLIAGGQSKDTDLSSLVYAIKKSCKAVVVIGEAASILTNLLSDIAVVSYAASMEAAVLAATKFACGGDVVLLSPACASFDMFTGFEDRGNQFVKAVVKVAGEIEQ